MGIGASIFLIAIGAILTWAIRDKPGASVDVDVVGIILMCVGLVGFFLSLWFWESWAGLGRWYGRGRYVQTAGVAPAAPRRYRYGPRRRATYVEEAPPEDPYAAPPPPPY